MVSIKDVAVTAGVSVGTVSRVINGVPNVGMAQRQRVERAIEQLGYRPHALAQGLRRQRSDTIGLLVPDIANPFFGELGRAVTAGAKSLGYVVLLATSDEDPDDEAAELRALADRRVDGLVMVPSVATTKIPKDIAAPVVVVDRRLRGVDSVSSNHAGGTRAATEHLAERGHQRIAFIAGPRELGAAEDRLRGWLSIAGPLLERGGIEPESYVEQGSFDYASGYRLTGSLVRRSPAPTAIVCSNDQQAIGALRACADLQIPVPDALSVIGFDDTALSGLLNPRLTTVAQPVAEMGRVAVERLAAKNDEKTRKRVKHSVLEPRLVVRDSTGAPPRYRPKRGGAD